MPIKCDRCDELAVVNVQKLWAKWDINPATEKITINPDMLDIEPGEGENLFLCNKHFKEFLAGK